MSPADALGSLAQAFAGRVVHVEPATLTGWPSAAVLEALAEGELWLASDLTAEAHPRSAWIAGCPLYADDWTAVDAQGRARAFRRLDREWYVWLYQAAQRARQRLDPETWRAMASRFNAVWAVACRWWGRAEVGDLHNDYALDARYHPPVTRMLGRALPPPTPAPAAGQPAEVCRWPLELRMAHAATCERVLRRGHGIVTDARGAYAGPEGLSHAELIRTAVAVARQVADAMRGKAAA